MLIISKLFVTSFNGRLTAEEIASVRRTQKAINIAYFEKNLTVPT